MDAYVFTSLHPNINGFLQHTSLSAGPLRILVVFGGSDPSNNTAKSLKTTLKSLDKHIQDVMMVVSTFIAQSEELPTRRTPPGLPR